MQIGVCVAVAPFVARGAAVGVWTTRAAFVGVGVTARAICWLAGAGAMLMAPATTSVQKNVT
jgi:hypothetical protein